MSDQKEGLVGASEFTFACKGVKEYDDIDEVGGFYLSDIEYVHKNYYKNKQVLKYVTALLQNKRTKTMIDSDIGALNNWLESDKYPLAKYPSIYSPTLMQQVAINIAVSEKERTEKIFSVNGPPGTGKTTLLKEIIVSNVEKLAEVLIEYGVDGGKFHTCRIDSASGPSYTEKYYEIPEDIAKYGILVVSNNNTAVENITLDLPKADSMIKDNTWTELFDRTEHKEIYFSSVADNLLGEENVAWGLISARMGKKSCISDTLKVCVFAKKNDKSDKVTLDMVKDDSVSWDEAVTNFNHAKRKVLFIRKDIEKDKQILCSMYKSQENLIKQQSALDKLNMEKIITEQKLVKEQELLTSNEKDTLSCEEEIKYIIQHSSFIKKVLIFLGLGTIGKKVIEQKNQIENLILQHSEINSNCSLIQEDIKKQCSDIEKQSAIVSAAEKEFNDLKECVYGNGISLKSKYKDNLADREFYENIKYSERSQNACPWTFPAYDKAREELFFAALQVRKAFILESPYIRRNLFVYEGYLNGKYTMAEKMEMFPHLLNSVSVVVPVISSTFASIGRFLKYAGNGSLGMLVVDEAGQAVPQSALGAIYRTKSAMVVGDPLQVEPVVTIPQVLMDILADSVGVPKDYKKMDNSVQSFADSMNEFNGMIGERQVGCPLVVHRRCIEPMFSISNMISYDNRMFNKTNKKEVYLSEEQSFLLKKSGWIDVKGAEKDAKNHFVEKQAQKVCQLLDKSTMIYKDIFKTEDKIFIISPFKTVAASMRTYITDYFTSKGLERDQVKSWTQKCVGTVHTFQGKDANEVFFVLGCSANSIGAINWVVKKPNILNVACTRAKYRIAFIGDLDIWKNRRFFSDFMPELIDEIDV